MAKRQSSIDGVSETGNKILGRADFNKPFGVLRYFIEQVNGIQESPITAAVQSAIAARVSNEFGMFSNLYRERHPGMEVADIFRDRDAASKVMSSAIDITSIRDTVTGDMSSLGSTYPELNQISTVGDAMDLLLRANIGGIRSQIKRLGEKRLDFGTVEAGSGDMFQEAFLTFFGSTPQFDISRKTSFPRFIQQQVFNRMVSVTREEKGSNNQNKSFEQLMGGEESFTGFDEPGYSPDNDSFSDMDQLSSVPSDFDLERMLFEAGEPDRNVRAPMNVFANSAAGLAGIPPGTEFDWSGKSPEQFTQITNALFSGKTIRLTDVKGNSYPVSLTGASLYPMAKRNTDRIYEEKDSEANDYVPGEGPSAIEQFDWMMGGAGRTFPDNNPVFNPSTFVEPTHAVDQPSQEALARYDLAHASQPMLPTSETTTPTSTRMLASAIGPFPAMPSGRKPYGPGHEPYFSTFYPPQSANSTPAFAGMSSGMYPQTPLNSVGMPTNNLRLQLDAIANSIETATGGAQDAGVSDDQLPAYVTQDPARYSDVNSNRYLDAERRGRKAAHNDFLLAGGYTKSVNSYKIAGGVADLDYTNRFDPVEQYPLDEEPDRKYVLKSTLNNTQYLRDGGKFSVSKREPRVPLELPAPFINPLEGEWLDGKYSSAWDYKRTHQRNTANPDASYTGMVEGGFEPARGDVVMAKRAKFDEKQKQWTQAQRDAELEASGGKSPLSMNSLSEGYQNAIDDAAYMDAIESIRTEPDVDRATVAEQIARNGIPAGFVGKAPSWISPDERARSTEEYNAMMNAGSYFPGQSRRLSSGDPNLEANNADGYGNEVLPPEDDEHPVTVNTPKPKAVQRHRGSDVGNLPNVRGGHGRATPEASRRHSADGDYIEPGMSNILGNSARAANPTGRTERNPHYTYDRADSDSLDRIKSQASHYVDYRNGGRNYAFSFYYPEGDDITKDNILAAANEVFSSAGIPFGNIEDFTGDDGFSGVRFNLPEGVTPTNRARAASDGADFVDGNENDIPQDTSADPFSGDWMGQDPGPQNGGPGHAEGAGGGNGGRRPPAGGGLGTGDPAGPGPARRNGRGGTPVPNRLLRDALNLGSRRSPNFNPSVNPLEAGTRAFGRSMGRNFAAWNAATRDNPEEFAVNASTMFENYLWAESEGTGQNFIDTNVPEGVRGVFGTAAQAGQKEFMQATNFARMASPSGVAAYFNNANRDRAHGGVEGGLAASYDNQLLGHAEQQRQVNGAGEIIGSRTVIKKNGEIVLDADQVDTATNIAQTAIAGATSRALPSEPGSAMATIQANINAIVDEHIKTIATAVRSSSASEDVVQRITTTMKDLALDETKRWTKVAAKELNGAELNGSPSGEDAGDVQHAAKKPKDLEDAKKILEDHPRIKTQVEKYAEDNNTSLEQMMGEPADKSTVFEDGDMAFQFGGNGRPRGEDQGWGSNRNKRGIWSGSIGTAMYAAYMGTRMWNMGMGETVQAATKYGEYASDAGNYAAGAGALGSASGFAARQSLGQMYEGRGAYQEFGAFMDASFYMSAGGSDVASRVWSSAKAGGTMAAEMAIGSSIIGSLPGVAKDATGLDGALFGASKALPGIGLAVGATMLLGTAGFEVYNSFHPGEDPVSWSSVLDNTVKSKWREDATDAFYKENPSRTNQPGRVTPADNIFSKLLLRSEPYETGPKIFNMGGDGANTPPTDDELKKYLTDEQKSAMFPERGADVEAAIKASKAFGAFGLDSTGQLSAAKSLLNISGIAPTEDIVKQFGASVARYGDQAISDAGQYAHNLGYTTGTEEYLAKMEEFAVVSDPTVRDNNMQTASRYAQVASQVSPYMVPTDWGTANKIASQYGINTQPKASSWQRLNQTISNFQVGALTEQQMRTTGIMATSSTPYQNQFIAQVGDLAGETGRDVTSAMSIAQYANLSPRQQAAVGTVMSGDLQGASYFANQGMISSKYGLYDPSGNPISETNGAAAMNVASQWSSTIGASWVTGATSTTDMAARFTGNNGNDVTNAFLQGGTRGIQDLSIKSSRDAQIASAGIQMAGIAQQRTYLWGSGSWSSPSANSAWGLQDQQVSMQYGFQQADFNYSQQSMDLSKKYASMSEANQQQRMNTSQSYNLWQMDFSHMQSLQQRNWTQQDYQYQDTQREENFDWQMTDINEDIRFAGGRQRRQLIRQRDRAALTHSQDDEQIDTTRGRQTELWAQEDERYAKQKAYTLELNDLDKQSFNTNRQQRLETYAMETENLARKRKEFDETQALEKQSRDLERDNQAKGLALQAASAGLQAQQAADQYRYSQAMLETNRNWTDALGKIQNSARYDAVNKFSDAMEAMVGVINSADTNKINQLIYLIQQLN
jgi:hypothetical protein